MLRTFLFLTADTQFEIVATGFKDACLAFEEQCNVPINDILAMEEHYPPSGNDTVHQEETMLKDMTEIKPGKSYACKFKVETMLDTFGRPPGLSDTPLRGPGMYEGFGVIRVRDTESKLVRVIDEASKKEFIVSWNDCWDIDEAVYDVKERED